MQRKMFQMKVLQYFQWQYSYYLLVLGFDTTGEKLQPVKHDSYVTVVKTRITPVDCQFRLVFSITTSNTSAIFEADVSQIEIGNSENILSATKLCVTSQ